MSFAHMARRLAGQAGLLLGWLPDAFWRSTPDELADAIGAVRDLNGAPEVPLGQADLSRLLKEHPDGG